MTFHVGELVVVRPEHRTWIKRHGPGRVLSMTSDGTHIETEMTRGWQLSQSFFSKWQRGAQTEGGAA